MEKSISKEGSAPVVSGSKAKKFLPARDLALVVSEDLLAFSIVEGSGFKRFSVRRGLIGKASDLLTRTTLSRAALSDAYDALKEMVKKKLPSESHFHVSTDIWTDRYRRLPYYSGRAPFH